MFVKYGLYRCTECGSRDLFLIIFYIFSAHFQSTDHKSSSPLSAPLPLQTLSHTNLALLSCFQSLLITMESYTFPPPASTILLYLLPSPFTPFFTLFITSFRNFHVLGPQLDSKMALACYLFCNTSPSNGLFIK